MIEQDAFSHTFYEFFAGSGMVRAGLGDSWKCLFANDFDPKKTASYQRNWGGEEISYRVSGISGHLCLSVNANACEALA